MITFNVEAQNISLVGSTPIGNQFVAGTIGEYTCEFIFGEEWNNYGKTAVFEAVSENGDVCCKRSRILNSNNQCVIPAQVLINKKFLRVGVYGTTANASLPTVYSPNYLIRAGAIPNTCLTLEDQSLVVQVLQEYGETKTKIDNIDNAIVDIDEAITEINEKVNQGFDELEIQTEIADHIYQGVDLTIKFASEIVNFSDEWAWIKSRITAGNYKGIHIGDYIPIHFTKPSVFTLNAQVAGIDTYYNYGPSADMVGHNIDFICKELWVEERQMNIVDYNNGVFTQRCPWLASDLYYYINSLKGQIPNSAVFNPSVTMVDYTSGGIYFYLPKSLKQVISAKQMCIEERFSRTELLTESTNMHLPATPIGRLWLPTEFEVYGAGIFNSNKFANSGCPVQYPIFANNIANRTKNKLDIPRYAWWLLSPANSNSTDWCSVDSIGVARQFSATFTRGVPVCFRVA